MTSWVRFWIEQARSWASRSKVPTTKVGCVLVGDSKEIVSVGFNGPPRGFPDSTIGELSRDHLRAISTHAEANAVANAARLGVSTVGTTAYVTHPPCAQCAALLVNAGVKRIYWVGELHPDWKQSIELAQWMLGKCGMEWMHIGDPKDES